jgi:hypothetical protein
MATQKVQALRDFVYDDQIGQVRTGQVFSLAGHVNDAGLLRHRFVAPYQGDKPVKDAKGREFAEEWQRTRAGDEDAKPPQVVRRERYQHAAERVELVGA